MSPPLHALATDLRKFVKNKRMVPTAVKEVTAYVAALEKRLKRDPTWQSLATFWPPRCVAALAKRAVVFFGSGVSLPSGIPTWSALLERFGLERALLDDEDLKNDPLTMAELANHFLGSEALQDILRKQMKEAPRFSVGHALLAHLGLPTYITTNYDDLFEKAWKAVHGNKRPLVVVTTDGDLAGAGYRKRARTKATVLYKIHGSANRLDEQMILTRRDYRSHYRSNKELFEVIRHLLGQSETIFVGFSHRDPEVSRLVEDAIHEYEAGQADVSPSRRTAPTPRFYSLQFDMRPHTPEAFAARGIVTLTPPVSAVAVAADPRTAALAVALVDLIAAREANLMRNLALDDTLREVTEPIGAAIAKALGALGDNLKSAASFITQKRGRDAWLAKIADELTALASQGVYLVGPTGRLIDAYIPPRLNRRKRMSRLKTLAFQERPYFQEAKVHRRPFASSSTQSIFNGQSTFFLCAPIVQDGEPMKGLLFTAVQIGQWQLPIDVSNWLRQQQTKDKDLMFLLIDSNGVCLVPPEEELELHDPDPGNQPGRNLGYPFDRLLALSRRHALVKHISRSVVPVAQDDDILTLSQDLKHYTVVTEVPRTRWKIGVSRAIHSK